MSWNDLDTPQLPFKKPRQIEELERLSPAQRNAMDFQEMKERVEYVAEGLLKSYEGYAQDGGTCEECTTLIAQALAGTGAGLGGELGAILVAKSEQMAYHVCRRRFPDKTDNLYVEEPFPGE